MGGLKIRSREDILGDLSRSVSTWDMALTERTVREALDAGIAPADIISEGLGDGMDQVGRAFNEGKMFLPQVVAASKAMGLAIEMLKPHLGSGEKVGFGTIVMSSVKGDIHEIGKNVCCAMLRGAGYNVIDLGCDKTADEIIECAKTKMADFIGASALMTTTLVAQKELVEAVRSANLDFKVVVGGAPCSQQWCDEIGADGYSANGSEIVALVKSVRD